MKVLVLTLLIFSSIFAQNKFWVKFGDKKIALKVIDGGFINIDCDKCKAFEIRKTEVNIRKKRLKERNPFSEACRYHDGKVIIGKLYSGHSQSFCRMKDKSIISTNVLKFKEVK